MKKSFISLYKIGFMLLVALAIPTLITAYPIQYRRLVLYKGEEIAKIVDLISDIHAAEAESSGDPICIMGPNDLKLYETLRKIGNRPSGDTIELFGESSDQLRYMVTKATEMSTSPIPTTCLQELAVKFYTEFNRTKNKKLVYTDSDTYREGGVNPKFILNLLNDNSLIEQDLLLLQRSNKIDSTTLATINKLWANLKLRMQEFSKQLRSISSFKPDHIFGFERQEDWEKFLQLPGYNELLIGTMDLEIIIKIFTSDYKHSIVFAGAGHCDNVAEMLTSIFSFKLVDSKGKSIVKEASERGLQKLSLDMQSQILKELASPLPSKVFDDLYATIVAADQAAQTQPSSEGKKFIQTFVEPLQATLSQQEEKLNDLQQKMKTTTDPQALNMLRNDIENLKYDIAQKNRTLSMYLKKIKEAESKREKN